MKYARPIMLFFVSLSIVYRSCAGDHHEQRLATPIDKVDKLYGELQCSSPDYKWCQKILSKPVNIDGKAIGLHDARHWSASLDIIQQLAQRGVVFPKSGFEKVYNTRPFRKYQSWRKAVLRGAVIGEQTQIYTGRPKLTRIAGKSRWDIIQEAARCHVGGWRCVKEWQLCEHMYVPCSHSTAKCPVCCRIMTLPRIASSRELCRYAYVFSRMLHTGNLYEHIKHLNDTMAGFCNTRPDYLSGIMLAAHSGHLNDVVSDGVYLYFDTFIQRVVSEARHI